MVGNIGGSGTGWLVQRWVWYRLVGTWVGLVQVGWYIGGSGI